MQQRNIIILLRVSAAAIFISQAWECLRWHTKINNVLLDPQRFGRILEWFYGTSRQEIYTSKMAEGAIVAADNLMGVLCLGAAVATVFISSKFRFWKWFIYLGTGVLCLICLAEFYDKNFRIGQLLEYSARLSAPLFLVTSTRIHNSNHFILFMKIAIGITFIGHGLFAVGYYPQPGHFVDMMIKGFRMQEELAKFLLIGFGVLDFLFAIAIFIPSITKPALFYGIAWGFATALARITTNFHFEFFENSLEQYLHEFMIRTPHFVLPLVLLISGKKVDTTLFQSRGTGE